MLFQALLHCQLRCRAMLLGVVQGSAWQEHGPPEVRSVRCSGGVQHGDGACRLTAQMRDMGESPEDPGVMDAFVNGLLQQLLSKDVLYQSMQVCSRNLSLCGFL